MDRHHPLAGQPVLRLRDCLMYPLALPIAPYGVRALSVLMRTSLRMPRTSLSGCKLAPLG